MTISKNYEATKTFLLSLISQSNKSVKVNVSEYAKLYNVDYAAAISTILIKEKYIERTFNNVTGLQYYRCNYTIEEVNNEMVDTLNNHCSTLIQSYRAARKQSDKSKTINPAAKEIVGVNRKDIEESFSTYTDGELLKELKRRGYTGDLSKMITVKV